MKSNSLWHDQTPPPSTEALAGDLSVDTIIVGAGFTGLWTAHYLKELDPSSEVAIVEANGPGFGASGRNGGWCIAELAASRQRWDSIAGPNSGERMDRSMLDTVDEIEKVIRAKDIDCDFDKYFFSVWLSK